MERYCLMAVVPTLTALLLSSLNDLQFFFVFLYALFEFCAQSIIGKCTSRHLLPYGGLIPVRYRYDRLTPGGTRGEDTTLSEVAFMKFEKRIYSVILKPSLASYLSAFLQENGLFDRL